MVEDVIQNWVRNCQLSSGDKLAGFLDDCQASLQAQEAFASAVVTSTEDFRSMVNAVVSLKASVTSLQGVADALVKAWSDIAYRSFQATSLRWYEEATVFRFITGESMAGLGVTGTFIATGAQYSQLVERYRSENGNLGQKIVGLPGGLPKWAAQPAL